MTRTQGKAKRFEGTAGLLIALVAGVCAIALVERLTRPKDGGPPKRPLPMPELLAEGWLNTGAAPAPSLESLEGKFVVLNFWSSDCLPCLQALPSLARFYDRWRDQEVELVSLTSEPAAFLPEIEAAVRRVKGFDWPVAYGAGMPGSQLGITMTPTYVLFGPDGKALWWGHTVAALEEDLATRF